MFSQQPVITHPAVTFGWVNKPHPASHAAFALRLIELCGDMKLPARGRQTQLARLFDVSQQATKKWLDGESLPKTETLNKIAEWAGVNVNWLQQGSGPKTGNRVDAKVLMLDEAIRSLPPEQGIDLIDNLRAKLVRFGKLSAAEPNARYAVMLKAYEHELKKPH
jgi:transcriptional regulator with XRE-family HTH domain